MKVVTDHTRRATTAALLAIRLQQCARDDWDDETIATVAVELAGDVERTLIPDGLKLVLDKAKEPDAPATP